MNTMPRKRGRSHRHPDAVRRALDRQQVMEWRATGMQVEAIAAKLDCHGAHVLRLIDEWYAANPSILAEKARRLDELRIEGLIYKAQALTDDENKWIRLKAIEEVRKLSERLACIVGSDVPARAPLDERGRAMGLVSVEALRAALKDARDDDDGFANVGHTAIGHA